MLKDQGERRVSKTAPSGEQKAVSGISESGTIITERIEITPEMIEAGARIFIASYEESLPTARDHAREVFEEMLSAAAPGGASPKRSSGRKR